MVLRYLLHLTRQSCNEIFPKNSDFDDSGIFLPTFPFRTYLKQCNIPVPPKMVMEATTNFDSSGASGPDYIAVLIPKNYEPD